ncbi:MAG: helicase associated domain-containing protein [Pseudomonadota bacterium]
MTPTIDLKAGLSFPSHIFFRELAAFRRRHGHCIIPRADPSNPELARWSEALRANLALASVKQLRRLIQLRFDFGRFANLWLE